MKKIYIISLLAFILINSLNGQKSDILCKENQFAMRPVYPIKPDNIKDNQQKSKSLIWKWDTIYTYDSLGMQQRHIQSFDSAGNVSVLLIENRVNNNWEFYKKFSNTYVSGEMVTEIIQDWQGSSWVNVQRQTYTYDLNGNVLINQLDSWNGSVWQNSFKYTNTYDSNDNILSQTTELWLNNAWINDMRYTYQYDSYNRLTDYLEEIWQTGSWVNYIRSSRTYSGDGLLMILIDEYWQTSYWELAWRGSFIFDSSGNELTRTYEVWQNNAWENSDRYSYTYNSGNKILSEIVEEFDNNVWEFRQRYTRTYDLNNNMTSFTFELWQSNDWINYYRYSYSFDSDNNSISGDYEVWENGDWQTGYVGMNLYSNGLIIYNLYYVYSSHYDAGFRSFISGLSDKSYNAYEVVIYPVPANEYIYIDVKESFTGECRLSVFDGCSRSVLEKTLDIQNINKIDISKLDNGLYYIVLQNETGYFTSKFAVFNQK